MHALYDVPHLVNLLKHNFSFKGKTVSFDDIRHLYMIDSNRTTTRAAPKLTRAHNNPSPFQKMNVALATQVMSHTTASALRTVVGTGQIKSITATAEFIDLMNSLFDVLNSKAKLSKNPDNCALSKENSHTTGLLNKGLDVFTNLTKIRLESFGIQDKSKTRKKHWNPRPPCLKVWF